MEPGAPSPAARLRQLRRLRRSGRQHLDSAGTRSPRPLTHHLDERSTIMGLSWQQGPLSGVSPGRFLTPQPLPDRLLFAEPLRRRLRAKLSGESIAHTEDVILLHDPGRYPVAVFPLSTV